MTTLLKLRRTNWCRGGLILLVLAAATGRSRAVPAAEFFVSPQGADSAAGDKESPFASLERARDAIRELRKDASRAQEPVTVWILGGDHQRTAAFELTAADSGTPAAPVVWRAAAGAAPRLLGGRVVAGFAPVQDEAVRQRLPTAARDHVRQIDLRAAGATDFGALASRGFSRPTTPAHVELFYDGRPMTLARWPNEGEWARIAGFPAATAQSDSHGGQIGKLEHGFQFGEDRPLAWQPSDDIWVHGYWAWDWANSYERIAKLDAQQRLITTAAPHGLYGFRKGQRYYFLNVLEELDQPGEWFLDRQAGRLYFWPPQPRDNLQVVLSLLDQPLLQLSGASHVVFAGLTLEATRGTGVTISGGSHNRIDGCAVRNVGNWAVKIDGGAEHGVVNCGIFDTGDGGVSLQGGDRQTLAAAGHFVDNCHFARQGRWSKCYVPAVLMGGVGMRASHNLIHDHPHCAILFNGNEHLLEFNEIHHIALETGDVGAIYTGRDWTFRGNRIRHNFIHHTGGVGMGSMGVYMDDCVSGTEVFGNVFYKVHWAMFIGGGRDHRVENNLFVDCDPAVRMDGRGLDKSPVWSNMVYDFMKKQMAAVPQELYRRRYPAIADLDRYYASRDGVPPEHNVVGRNVCVGKWLEVGWHARQDWLSLEHNHVGADVGLADVAAMDFRIRPDSPVWATGFQPIPFEQIGLQPGHAFADPALTARPRQRTVRVSQPSANTDDEQGFTPMFNGKDLSGWEGQPGWWEVRDGSIVAESTPEKPCTRSHYLYWTTAEPGDFEMRCRYRISGDANTGVQFRSRKRPNWDTWGYQADADTAGRYTGCLYQHERGLVAERGQEVVFNAAGEKTIKTFADAAELLKSVRPNAWNDYRILAQGRQLTIWINGVLMCRVEDHQERFALPKGIIALQMHQGPPMKVEFRDLRIRMF